MMELMIIAETNKLISETKNETEKEILTAFLSRKVIDSKKEEILPVVIQAVGIARAILGNQTQSDDQFFEITCMELTEAIKTRFPNLHLNEIQLAVRKGARGELGDFFGLSVKTVFNWLVTHYNSEKRSEIKSKVLSQQNAKEQPKIEKDRVWWIQETQKAYETFKERGFYNDYGNAIYSFLDSEGLVELTKDQKIEIFNQAKEKEKKRLSNPLTLPEYNEFKSQLEKINAGQTDYIKSLAKQIALNKIFFDYGHEIICSLKI